MASATPALLTEDEVKKVTLSAPFVYKYAAHCFFLHAMNNIPRVIALINKRRREADGGGGGSGGVSLADALQQALAAERDGSAADEYASSLDEGLGSAITLHPRTNFFVRYKPAKTPGDASNNNNNHNHNNSNSSPMGSSSSSKYRFGKVDRVVFIRSADSGSNTDARIDERLPSETINWRGKMFCVALRLAGSGADGDDGETIQLSDVSSRLPSNEEIRDYCRWLANQHNPHSDSNNKSTNAENDNATGEGEQAASTAEERAVAEQQQEEQQQEQEEVEATDAAQGNGLKYTLDEAVLARLRAYDGDVEQASEAQELRAYLPNTENMEFLDRYLNAAVVKHIWTDAEREENSEWQGAIEAYNLSKASGGRGEAGVPVNKRPRTEAAAMGPIISTLTHVNHLRYETRRQLASQGLGRTDSTVSLSQSQQQEQQQRGDGSEPPQSQSQSRNSSAFLPRKVWRRKEEASASSAGASQATPASGLNLNDLQERDTVAGDALSPGDIFGGQPSGTQTRTSASRVLMDEEEERERIAAINSQYQKAEESFYHYIADGKRSEYIEKFSKLTKKNIELNKKKLMTAIKLKNLKASHASNSSTVNTNAAGDTAAEGGEGSRNASATPGSVNYTREFNESIPDSLFDAYTADSLGVGKPSAVVPLIARANPNRLLVPSAASGAGAAAAAAVDKETEKEFIKSQPLHTAAVLLAKSMGLSNH